MGSELPRKRLSVAASFSRTPQNRLGTKQARSKGTPIRVPTSSEICVVEDDYVTLDPKKQKTSENPLRFDFSVFHPARVSRTYKGIKRSALDMNGQEITYFTGAVTECTLMPLAVCFEGKKRTDISSIELTAEYLFLMNKERDARCIIPKHDLLLIHYAAEDLLMAFRCKRNGVSIVSFLHVRAPGTRDFCRTIDPLMKKVNRKWTTSRVLSKEMCKEVARLTALAKNDKYPTFATWARDTGVADSEVELVGDRYVEVVDEVFEDSQLEERSQTDVVEVSGITGLVESSSINDRELSRELIEGHNHELVEEYRRTYVIGLPHPKKETPSSRKLSTPSSTVKEKPLPERKLRLTKDGGKKHQSLGDLRFLNFPFDHSLNYKFRDNSQITITVADHGSLAPRTWVNDTVIDFFAKYYADQATEDPCNTLQETDVFVLSAFVFTKIMASGGDYTDVLRWVGKATPDLFQYKSVILPINQKDHWYCAVIVGLLGLWNPPKAKNLERVSKYSTHKKSPSEKPKTSRSDQPIKSQILETFMQSKVVAEKPGQKSYKRQAPNKLDCSTPEIIDSDDDNDEVLCLEDLQPPSPDPTPSLLPHATIYVCDSLGIPHPKIEDPLRNFLAAALLSKHNVTLADPEKQLVVKRADVPHQKNYIDCGVRVIHNLQKFLDHPDAMVAYWESETKDSSFFGRVTGGIIRAKYQGVLSGLLESQVAKVGHPRDLGTEVTSGNLSDDSDIEMVDEKTLSNVNDPSRKSEGGADDGAERKGVDKSRSRKAGTNTSLSGLLLDKKATFQELMQHASSATLTRSTPWAFGLHDAASNTDILSRLLLVYGRNKQVVPIVNKDIKNIVTTSASRHIHPSHYKVLNTLFPSPHTKVTRQLEIIIKEFLKKEVLDYSGVREIILKDLLSGLDNSCN
ncbi:hypothetical protein BABINDRAFT_161671 [Babjeviella inositovora NRRL Y-12698]|uniref:Ubiquitin-like protease family profile domain-containing protein n=1 Tax=Babjeviella inositovora NRRL Y-12698 TaxID=984486 RepID=A0A1E3QQW6_9ASCO|nr:uncharacterized protein BABINDRAFT_161671 [Babjeviella inositovora NRRL Y-12698]ODQ80028.1 hypothetical protein BABINDRAFT_161671 [Babjeviella inositovora NRRL Y-12698]